MAAPDSVILRTSRLELHAVRMTDAAFLCGLLNQPDFKASIGDKGVRTAEDARHYIAEGPLADHARYGYGGYLVRERRGGEPVGLCGLYRRDDLEHPDLGFALRAGATGRGYATEAGEGVVAHARSALCLPRLAALVNKGNQPSLAVVRRLGFEPVGTYAKGESGPELMYFELQLRERAARQP